MSDTKDRPSVLVTNDELRWSTTVDALLARLPGATSPGPGIR